MYYTCLLGISLGARLDVVADVCLQGKHNITDCFTESVSLATTSFDFIARDLFKFVLLHIFVAL